MNITRRDGLMLLLAAGAAGLVPGPAWSAAGGATLRLGLWGCDARGIALAVSALRSGHAVELHAIADADPQRARRAAAWWRNPAQRAALRERAVFDDAAVWSGPGASAQLAATPLDAILVAAPPMQSADDLFRRHACVWPVDHGPQWRGAVERAGTLAKAEGRVLRVCIAPDGVAHSDARQRAGALAAFFDAIRAGRAGDVDGQLTAWLARASAQTA
jgi:hypothetical protein